MLGRLAGMNQDFLGASQPAIQRQGFDGMGLFGRQAYVAAKLPLQRADFHLGGHGHNLPGVDG